MKILILYAGIAGESEKWNDVKHDITHIEIDPKLSKVISERKPNRRIITGEAVKYLLSHYQEYDFIWFSPPCQANTRMIRSGKNRKPRLPDLTVYEIIIFLKYNYKGWWLGENVVPYYETMMYPKKIGRHLFWSNFGIRDYEHKNIKGFIDKCNVKGSEEMKDWLGIHYEGNIYYDNNHDPCQVLRNCVHPDLGLHIFNCIPK